MGTIGWRVRTLSKMLALPGLALAVTVMPGASAATSATARYAGNTFTLGCSTGDHLTGTTGATVGAACLPIEYGAKTARVNIVDDSAPLVYALVAPLDQSGLQVGPWTVVCGSGEVDLPTEATQLEVAPQVAAGACGVTAVPTSGTITVAS